LFILPSLICTPHSINYKYLQYIYYLVITRHEKFDKILFKAPVLLSAATTFRWGDTSIAESLDINL